MELIEDWILCDGMKIKEIISSSEYTKLDKKLQDQYADLLKGTSGAQVCEDDSILLGGLSITAKDSKCIIDKTLDTAFDEQRKAFSTTYHLGE